MAIYHLTAKTGSRAKGQSAHAAASYIVRTGRYANDFDEVLYAGSGNMPGWAAESALDYWDAADLYERANGRLYKSIEFALPVELNAARRRDLAVTFAHRLTFAEKLPFTLAIHRGKDHNPHVHLMISERPNDGLERPPERWFKRYVPESPERGGARKTESLKPKEWLTGARERWADMANEALAAAGHDDRIDHRTLAEQGIDRTPTQHLGPAQHKMLLKGLTLDIAVDLGMAAADIGPPAPSPFGPGSQHDAPEKPEERRPAQPDRTARAVQRQAAAMGCEYFDVGIQHASGELVEHRWALQALLDNLQRLKRLNAQGRNILIKPSFHPLPGMVLVDGLSADAVERMRGDGLEPVVTVETAPNAHQVWVRVGEHILKSRRDRIALHLAEAYGGDVAAAGANAFGRLAGFTSGEALPGGQRPFVTLKQSDSSGRIAGAAADVLRATRTAPRPPEDAPNPDESDRGAG